MRDVHYTPKRIRMSEEVWQKLQKKKKASGLTWNLFIKGLLTKLNDRL